MIVYPDQFGSGGLQAVDDVVSELSPAINGVHVLPFHPSSSDGGFSVEDYGLVDPAVGNWSDVRHLGERHRLMADAVINHVSAQGTWFRSHLAGDADRQEFFRVVPMGTGFGAVVRPRPGRPVTSFLRSDGSIADYWTTFGADQVDLDYRSPEVLLAVFEAVFRYVAAGSSAIRLDAVAFLWKDPSASSVHMKETHAVVALLRDCLDELDPTVVLITETNVAHDDNMSYLGTVEQPEAHAVYQFTLAPLVLHALQTGDVAPLRRWAGQLEWRADTTGLNFLAGHDGVGVRPAQGWLARSQIDMLAERCREAGGSANEAAVDGHLEVYELAATWRSLCERGEGAPFSDDAIVARHLATHSVALALRGLPLLYVHSLVGSRNAEARAAESGVTRDVNRERFSAPAEFLGMIEDRVGIAGRTWTGLREMLEWRGADNTFHAFHPDASQEIWDNEGTTLVVERVAEGGARALVLTNLGAEGESIEIGRGWRSLRNGELMPSRCDIGPWGRNWLVRSTHIPDVSPR